VRTECGCALSCRLLTGPGDANVNFCFWTTLEVDVRGNLYVDNVDRSLARIVSGKVCTVSLNSAYYSTVAKYPLLSEPPYNAPWTLPPVVVEEARKLIAPLSVIENEARTLWPLESSSMQYTVFDAESNVNHEGFLPQVLVDDLIVKLGCWLDVGLGRVYARV
jgi:hypothetical protein